MNLIPGLLEYKQRNKTTSSQSPLFALSSLLSQVSVSATRQHCRLLFRDKTEAGVGWHDQWER